METLKNYVNWKLAHSDKVADADGYPLAMENCKTNKRMKQLEVYGDCFQSQTPSPDNPSEIQSVGDLTTLNIFDMTKARSISSIELHEDENYFDIINNYACQFMSIADFMSLGFEAGDTITTVKTAEVISGEATGSTGAIVLLSKNSTYPNIGLSSKIGYQIMTTTLPLDFDPSNYHGLYTYAVPGSGIVRYKNVMMLKGAYTEETIPKYEPYHKYKIPVVVRGKNLLDDSFLSNISGITYQDGWYQGSAYSFLYYTTKNKNISGFFKPNTQYTFSWTVNTQASGLSFVVYYTDGTNIRLAKASSTNTDLYLTGTSQVGKSIDYATIDYGANGTCKIKNIQIEKGTTATEYEPYIEPITQNIYLNEPLRKVEDYADYIDFKNQKVIRNVKEVTFDGTENWGYRDTDNIIYLSINNLAPSVYCYSTHFLSEALKDTINPYFRPITNVLRLYQQNGNILYSSADEFKIFLANQNTAGTPLIVYCLLSIPIEEDISCQLPKTLAKTTIIDVDTILLPSNIKGKYVIK